MGQEAAATCSCIYVAVSQKICICGYLCIDKRNQLCVMLFRSIQESCFVTDPSEVFLPCYGPLNSVAFDK